MRGMRLAWAGAVVCACVMGCGDDDAMPHDDDAGDAGDQGRLTDGRGGGDGDEDLCDASPYAFFDFCDPGHCQIDEEQCVAGRCYLPCDSDADCPILTISAGSCSGGLHAGEHRTWLCSEVPTEFECAPGTEEAADDEDGDPCDPIFLDGTRSREVPLVCGARPDGTLGCLLPSMVDRWADAGTAAHAGSDADAGSDGEAVPRLCQEP